MHVISLGKLLVQPSGRLLVGVGGGGEMSIKDKKRPVITSFPLFILIFWPGDRAERM